MRNKEKNLTFMGHLHELRIRLIRIVIVLIVMVILAFTFHEEILEVLRYPAPDNITLQAIKLTEMFSTSMRISMIAGIIGAVPYITWELLMFVSPALTRREKKYIYIIFPWVILMFCAGVAFAYFYLIPRIIEFLLGWGADIVTIQPMFSDYVNIVTRLLLVSGLVFEFPVLTTFLSRIGLVNPNWLAGKRRAAILIAFILAALITPTPDPINQSIVAAVLIVLYEMSIWLSKLVYRKKDSV
ncbi:MAG: twin-arginine translocase subunit TatC [Dehalococcoidales bacterium]|nr:twin-arginine translocase subunit TatC [Dehalococcoidales bacterium]